MEQQNTEEWIRTLGVGVRPMNDPFFEDGDRICQVYRREGIIDIDDESLCHKEMKTFVCEIFNCKAEFDNLLSYEMHYNSLHRYTCSECKKQLPSSHLLDLHISEMHDSFFMALAERKAMFRCFVESCPVLSKDAKERRSHCIEVHKYPHDFKFDSSNRKKQPKKKSSKEEKKQENAMDCASEVLNNKKPVPPAVFTFGNKKMGKTFKTSKDKKEKPIEMHELMESLPS